MKKESGSRKGKLFPETDWSLIGRIQSRDEKVAARALEEIFTIYRYPLYSFLRISDMSHEDAEDVLQDFFAKLLRNDSLRRARQDHGKLRTYLLSALVRFRINWLRNRRRARGPESAESDLWGAEKARYQQEQLDTKMNPETFFDRRWAIELLYKARLRLVEQYEQNGKRTLHDTLLPTLAIATGDGRGHDIAALAAMLGMTEKATRTALSRFRADFRACLIDEVRLTVRDDREVKGEIAYLLGLFQRK